MLDPGRTVYSLCIRCLARRHSASIIAQAAPVSLGQQGVCVGVGKKAEVQLNSSGTTAAVCLLTGPPRACPCSAVARASDIPLGSIREII